MILTAPHIDHRSRHQCRKLVLIVAPSSSTLGLPENQCLYDAGPFVDGNIQAMAGHEDGIIGFGFDAAEAGEVVLRYLHIARAQS